MPIPFLIGGAIVAAVTASVAIACSDDSSSGPSEAEQRREIERQARAKRAKAAAELKKKQERKRKENIQSTISAFGKNHSLSMSYTDTAKIISEVTSSDQRSDPTAIKCLQSAYEKSAPHKERVRAEAACEKEIQEMEELYRRLREQLNG